MPSTTPTSLAPTDYSDKGCPVMSVNVEAHRTCTACTIGGETTVGEILLRCSTDARSPDSLIRKKVV